MTRTMEDAFLRSPDHLEIETGLRRAGATVLGADPPLVEAVMSTLLASECRSRGSSGARFGAADGRGRSKLALYQVGPMVDFHAIRHQRVQAQGRTDL